MSKEKKAAAQEALLDAIIRQAEKAGNASHVRDLAEAYSLVRIGDPGKPNGRATLG